MSGGLATTFSALGLEKEVNTSEETAIILATKKEEEKRNEEYTPEEHHITEWHPLLRLWHQSADSQVSPPAGSNTLPRLVNGMIFRILDPMDEDFCGAPGGFLIPRAASAAGKAFGEALLPQDSHSR